MLFQSGWTAFSWRRCWDGRFHREENGKYPYRCRRISQEIKLHLRVRIQYSNCQVQRQQKSNNTIHNNMIGKQFKEYHPTMCEGGEQSSSSLIHRLVGDSMFVFSAIPEKFHHHGEALNDRQKTCPQEKTHLSTDLAEESVRRQSISLFYQ